MRRAASLKHAQRAHLGTQLATQFDPCAVLTGRVLCGKRTRNAPKRVEDWTVPQADQASGWSRVPIGGTTDERHTTTPGSRCRGTARGSAGHTRWPTLAAQGRPRLGRRHRRRPPARLVQVGLGQRLGSRLQPGQCGSGHQRRCHRRQPGKPDHRQDPALRTRRQPPQAATASPISRWSPTASGCPWSPTPPPRAPRSRHRAACSPLPTSAPSPITSRTSHCRPTAPCWSPSRARAAMTRCSSLRCSTRRRRPPSAWPNWRPAAATVCAAWLARTSACRTLGLTAAQVTAPEHVAQLDSIGDTQSTAVAMTMLHPNVATKDPTSATATKSVLGQTPEIGTLGTYIATMQSQGKDFAKYAPITDPNGSATQFQFKDANGNVTQTFTSTTIQMNPSGDGTFASTLTGRRLRECQDGAQYIRSRAGRRQADQRLSRWARKSRPGSSRRASTRSPRRTHHHTPSPVALGSSGSVDVNIANSGLLYGTYTKNTGGINSSRQVPITHLQQLRALDMGVRPVHRHRQGWQRHQPVRQFESQMARHPLLPVIGHRAPGLHGAGHPAVGHQHRRRHADLPTGRPQSPPAVLRAGQRRLWRKLAPVLPFRRLPGSDLAHRRGAVPGAGHGDPDHRAERLRVGHRHGGRGGVGQHSQDGHRWPRGALWPASLPSGPQRDNRQLDGPDRGRVGGHRHRLRWRNVPGHRQPRGQRQQHLERPPRLRQHHPQAPLQPHGWGDLRGSCRTDSGRRGCR